MTPSIPSAPTNSLVSSRPDELWRARESAEPVTINELAELVRTLAGSLSEVRHVPYREAFGAGFEDMQRRVPDLTKVHAAIGYRPRHSLRDILREVIEYERSAESAELRVQS